MFFCFSNAFKTIQPLLLREKLTEMRVDTQLVTLITDYLTGRPQYVKLRDSISEIVVSSTRELQGTVLSSVLFTLYTSRECRVECFVFWSLDSLSVATITLNIFSQTYFIIQIIRRGGRDSLKIVSRYFKEICDIDIGMTIKKKQYWAFSSRCRCIAWSGWRLWFRASAFPQVHGFGKKIHWR